MSMVLALPSTRVVATPNVEAAMLRTLLSNNTVILRPAAVVSVTPLPLSVAITPI